MRFELVIPTRNGARWLGQFLTAYRKLGIEPFYIVDARSDDGTEELLRSAGARVAVGHMEANFVEGGMIEFASRLVERDWILRIDDDEFPSRRLLRWADEIGCGTNVDYWGLSRLTLFRYEDGIKYCRLASYYHSSGGLVDPQVRLYRHGQVEYHNGIHCAGFKSDRAPFAPPDALLVHCDVLLRSLGERIEKLRRYEAAVPGSSWKFGYHCLLELLPRADHRPAQLPTDEFDALLASLPRPQASGVTITKDEREMIRLGAEELTRKNRRFESPFANRTFAEFLCTTGKAISFLDRWLPAQGVARRLHQYGADLYWGAELRKKRRSGDPVS